MLSYYRYIGVVRSLQTSSLSTIEMARIHVALVLIISFILEIPRYFELQISELTCNGNRFLIPITTDLVYNQVYHILYRSIFTVIVRRILPLVITSILTFCMVKYLREQNQRRKRLLASHTSTNGEIMPASNEYLTKVLAWIVVAYIICLLPGAIYPILRNVVSTSSCTSFFNVFGIIADTLSILNSALNFFIYYPNIPLFRECLKKMFGRCRCCCSRGNKVYPSRNSVNVVVTVVSRVEITPCH